MKSFYFFLTIIVCLSIIPSCNKDNNNRFAIHEILYPRKMIYLKIDSLSRVEDTFRTIDYFKQSNSFDYDSIEYNIYNISGLGVNQFLKLRFFNQLANSYEIIADSIDNFLFHKNINLITFSNNNITKINDGYSNCASLDPNIFSYDFQYNLVFDSINRIKAYSYIPYSSSCGSNYSTTASYRFTSNEDTCFVKYETDACVAEDTILYYNDIHRSSIPFLSYTYKFLSPCYAKSFNEGNYKYPGFDLYKYSDYQYKLIKEVRIHNPYISYNFQYSYQFDSNDNVKEVLVKPSQYFGGFLYDYKIKFYY